ncbi:hypothetical protein FRC19_010706 [Serendipita sp. 401]|nr:hypothetical protein FRC19_010706 [Serendipita sp. 401]KAG9052071.1 hypothetical protein FS842_010543 [Serendipita sp. 407]
MHLSFIAAILAILAILAINTAMAAPISPIDKSKVISNTKACHIVGTSTASKSAHQGSPETEHHEDHPKIVRRTKFTVAGQKFKAESHTRQAEEFAKDAQTQRDRAAERTPGSSGWEYHNNEAEINQNLSTYHAYCAESFRSTVRALEEPDIGEVHLKNASRSQETANKYLKAAEDLRRQ